MSVSPWTYIATRLQHFSIFLYCTLYFWGRDLFCKTATVTKATIAMTPITVMMMVTGVCQGFFSFISESGGGNPDRQDRQTGRGSERVAGVERGRWGNIGKRNRGLANLASRCE